MLFSYVPFGVMVNMPGCCDLFTLPSLSLLLPSLLQWSPPPCYCCCCCSPIGCCCSHKQLVIIIKKRKIQNTPVAPCCTAAAITVTLLLLLLPLQSHWLLLLSLAISCYNKEKKNTEHTASPSLHCCCHCH